VGLPFIAVFCVAECVRALIDAFHVGEEHELFGAEPDPFGFPLSGYHLVYPLLAWAPYFLCYVSLHSLAVVNFGCFYHELLLVGHSLLSARGSVGLYIHAPVGVAVHGLWLAMDDLIRHHA